MQFITYLPCPYHCTLFDIDIILYRTAVRAPYKFYDYYDDSVQQCDFRFDLFFSFSFSFPVIFSF